MIRQVSVLLCLLTAACSRPQPPLEVIGTVPAFALTAQTGQPFDSSKELAGRIWVADFIFTNCKGPCPRMTSQMRRIQAAVPDVRLVSFTLDPERDTPAVLEAYAKLHQAASGWWFLTGSQADLHKLKREVFLLGNVDGELNHSTRFVLVDGQSRIRAYYDTSEPDSIKRAVADIERLRKESSSHGSS